ncbi:MAG: hypothetical protein AAF656_04125 [Planctomycetota bacterium]
MARSYLRAYTKWARYDRQGSAIEIRPALALLEQGGEGDNDDDEEVEPLLRFGVHKLAARIFGSGTHPASDAELAEKHESAAIDAAIDLLADTTVPPERERINLHETYIRHYQRDADASVARIVAALPDDETHWTQNLIAGEHLYSRSFRRSGNDDDGVRSQAYLRRAHALRPEWPEASVGLTLLTLRRDAAGVGDPRQWFESAIAAQLDYVEAWEQFSWTQRPRWGGSIEALVRLVEQGAATEAYDTAVPHEIARGIKHLLDETDNDVDPFRSDPRFAPLRPIVSEVYPPLIDALAQRGFDTSALEAEFVAALWLVGAWDEAAKRWPEAEGEDRRVAQALPMALRKFSGLVDDARFEIALAQRGRHADYRRIRDALIDNDSARLVEADDLLAELFDEIDDPAVQATVPRLAADVNLALKVQSEEWVEVPLDPAARHVENGTLDVVDGGLVLIAGGADRAGAPMAILRTPMPPRYEVEATLRVTDTSWPGLVYAACGWDFFGVAANLQLDQPRGFDEGGDRSLLLYENDQHFRGIFKNNAKVRASFDREGIEKTGLTAVKLRASVEDRKVIVAALGAPVHGERISELGDLDSRRVGVRLLDAAPGESVRIVTLRVRKRSAL